MAMSKKKNSQTLNQALDQALLRYQERVGQRIQAILVDASNEVNKPVNIISSQKLPNMKQSVRENIPDYSPQPKTTKRKEKQFLLQSFIGLFIILFLLILLKWVF